MAETFHQESIAEAVVALAKSELPAYTFYDEAVPAAETIKRDANGSIVSYIAYQVSDIRYAGNGSFGGVRHGEYTMSFDFQIISESPSVAKKIRSHLNNKLLGAKPSGQPMGQLGKEFGLGDWVILDPQSKPQAYVASSSFRAPITLVTGM